MYSIQRMFRFKLCVLCLKYLQVWTMCTLFKVCTGWNTVYSVQRMFRFEPCVLCSKYVQVGTLCTTICRDVQYSVQEISNLEIFISILINFATEQFVFILPFLFFYYFYFRSNFHCSSIFSFLSDPYILIIRFLNLSLFCNFKWGYV